ncbi:MAG: glycoside hydrolase family 25 protein [Candidatus Thorarchaeota archaeon]|jgi:lysozyme
MKETDYDHRAEDLAPPQQNIFSRVKYYITALFLDLVEGLDLSHWREGVPIRTAKRQGMRFIITKATQGNYFFDSTYEHYRDETKAKGLPFGAFHYWDASIAPLEQAKYFFDHVGDDIDLLPILDVEKYGNDGVLSQAAAAQHVHDTLLEIEKLFGRKAMIYTNYNSWQVLTANSPIIAAFALWVASWTTGSSPMLPVGATEWTFWQYTNNYQVEGYPKGVDANRFNGNEAEFEKYVASLNGTPPPPPPPPPEHDHAEILAKLDELELRLKTVEVQMPGIQDDITLLTNTDEAHAKQIDTNRDDILYLKNEFGKLKLLIKDIGNKLINFS